MLPPYECGFPWSSEKYDHYLTQEHESLENLKEKLKAHRLVGDVPIFTVGESLFLCKERAEEAHAREMGEYQDLYIGGDNYVVYPTLGRARVNSACTRTLEDVRVLLQERIAQSQAVLDYIS